MNDIKRTPKVISGYPLSISFASSANDSLKMLFNPNQCFPILMGVFLVIMYIICFVGMYMVNTEIISMGLFFALHIIFTVHVLKNVLFGTNSSNKLSESNKMYILPTIISKDIETRFDFIIGNMGFGSIRIITSIVISTLLMLISLITIVITYSKLHADSIKTESPIDFGNQMETKDHLKIALIIETILLWILYGIYIGYDLIQYTISEYFIRGQGPSGKKKTSEWMINAVCVMTSVLLFGLSLYSGIIGFEMAKKVGAL